MAYEEKEGFGGLFVNSYKEKDAHPDYKGTIMIDGKVHKLAGWNKEYGGGKTRISLAVDTFVPQEGFDKAHAEVDKHAAIVPPDNDPDCPF